MPDRKFMVYHDDRAYIEEHGERSLGTVTASSTAHARTRILEGKWASRTRVPLIHGLPFKFVELVEDSFLDDL